MEKETVYVDCSGISTLKDSDTWQCLRSRVTGRKSSQAGFGQVSFCRAVINQHQLVAALKSKCLGVDMLDPAHNTSAQYPDLRLHNVWLFFGADSSR